MECPVCGGDCIRPAEELTEGLEERYAPCPDCRDTVLPKTAPPSFKPQPPCSCGRRPLDEIVADIWTIMAETGDLAPDEPLMNAGVPLIDPGCVLEAPPHVGKDGLVFLSKKVTQASADRIFAEIPEVKGVVRDFGGVPGIRDTDGEWQAHELLAGCDVRANIFETEKEPVVTYLQQSVFHIEFPRAFDPKIINTSMQAVMHGPEVFFDACCGAGRLTLAAAQYGIPQVVMNDAWYGAAYWAAVNLEVNRTTLGLEAVEIFFSYDECRKTPVRSEPVKIAGAAGAETTVAVWQGDFRLLGPHLPAGHLLTVLDLFGKEEHERMEREQEALRQRIGGIVFIP